MGNIFLIKVYRQNKLLFCFFSLFILGQAFFFYKGVETTPFYLYGMYSAKQSPKKTYPVFIIEINGKEFNYDKLPSASREMIISSLEHYRTLEENNFRDTILPVIEKRFKGKVTEETFQVIANRLTNDSTDRIPYQNWLKEYLKETTGEEIKSLRVFTKQFSYDLKPENKELLFEE
jgi:hypothetical protein